MLLPERKGSFYFFALLAPFGPKLATEVTEFVAGFLIFFFPLLIAYSENSSRANSHFLICTFCRGESGVIRFQICGV